MTQKTFDILRYVRFDNFTDMKRISQGFSGDGLHNNEYKKISLSDTAGSVPDGEI